jgi:hypothetical protein
MDDGRVWMFGALAILLGGSAIQGSRGVVRRSRGGAVLPDVQAEPPTWVGDADVLDSDQWENEDGPVGWFALADDHGIHAYAPRPDLLHVLAGHRSPLRRRTDPLIIIGPLPHRRGVLEPGGWWRVESRDEVRIAYAGTEALARYIALLAPEDP